MRGGTLAWWDLERPPGGWTVSDGALALGFLLLLVTEIVPNPDMTPHVWLLAASVVIAGPLAWRRSLPAPVAVTICCGHLASSAVSTGTFAPQLTILPVLVAIYSAASRTRGRTAFVTGVLTALLTAAAWLVTDEGHADDFWPWMLWAGAWATGTFVRRRGDAAAEHAARAALLEVQADLAAAESAQAERDRIARELHDVVAHSVSVMVVQAGAERMRLGADAGRTGDALRAIEESGRSALAELRAMLGVLRDGSDQTLAPLPGLEALPALVERLRRAGLPVEFTCRPESLVGSDSEVGHAAGLAAYRIVQEALTNVMRHAGMVATRVELEIDGDALAVRVTNRSGGAARGPGTTGGRGMPGMRERAEALGGSFEAAATGDGFSVRARLPLRPAPVEA